MKRLFPAAATTLTVILLTGCPSGADVHIDYDHHANFSQLKTFSFGPVETDNPLYQQRIKDEVSKDLEARGLRAAQGTGDLVVTAVGAVHNRKEYSTFYNNPGFGWYWGGFGPGFGPGYTTTTVQHYRVGTLVLDMYNSSNKQLVWRGTASQGVSHDSGDNTSHLFAAIDHMLSGFPPS